MFSFQVIIPLIGIMLITIFIMASTIGLDVLVHHLALQNNVMDFNAGVVTSKEDKQRREKIPKRATIINSCLFVPWIVYAAAIGNAFELELETKVLLIALPNAMVNGLRNPLIARLAFHVNDQIKRQTVEDRRNDEIKAALAKREERRKQHEQPNQIEEPEPPRPKSIVTLSGLVDKNTLVARSSLPSIHI